MGCPDNSFKYLSSEANARETLVKVGAIDNQDKIIDRNKFKEQAKRFLDYVKKDFNLDVVSVISAKNLVAQFNKDVFSKIDKIRGYDKINKQTINNALNPVKEVIKPKEGVDFVFEQFPELAKIGSKEQYSQYISTIFQTSLIKDIVYHGSNREFENFSKEFIGRGFGGLDLGDGFYFTRDNKSKFHFGDNIKNVILNITNPYEPKDKFYKDSRWDIDKLTERLKNRTLKPELTKEEIDNLPSTILKKEKFDGIIEGKQVVVFEPSQIHILGSKQDIEGFKKFMKNPIKSSVKNNILSKTIEINNLADELGLDKNCN